MPLARIPLANQIESRQPNLSRDSRSVNVLFEGDGDRTRIIKRPGLGQLACTPALPTGTGQGLFSWYNRILVVISNTVYSVSNGVREILGTIVGDGTKPLSFTKTANETNIAFHDGNNLYNITKSGLVVSQPISSDHLVSTTVTNGGGTYNQTATVTITIASPCVVSHATHGLIAGQGVRFTTAAYLPTGIVAGTTYAVASAGLTAGSYQLVTTGLTPTAINTSGVQLGPHTVHVSPTVTFSNPPTPSNRATGTAVVYNNRVTEIVLSAVGIGYTVVPTCTLSAPTTAGVTATGTVITRSDRELSIVSSISITNGGGFYVDPPLVSFALINPSLVIEHIHAAGYAVLTNGVVTSVVITTGGAVAPITPFLSSVLPVPWTVSFTAPASVTATATANVASSTISGPYAYGIEYMDGYVFIMGTNSRIYASALEDPTSWDGTYVAAASDPDLGVALVRHLNYLIAFGQWSTDFYYNAGNTTGSPLAVNKQAKLTLGCANGASVAKVEQSILWVSNSLTQGRSVYLMNGLSPQKVSTRHIDKYLNKDSMLNVHSYCMRMAGHTLYVLTLKDSDVTFVFDIDEQVWYQWTSQTGSIESYFKYLFFTGHVEYVPDLYLQHETNGLLYTMSADYYKDAGEDIWFRSVSGNLDSGTNKRKFITRAEVIGDKISGNVSVRHTDDDYQTWSSYRTVNLINRRPVLYQLGNTRRRAWEVFSSADIPIRLEALELDFDIGETGGGQEG